MTLDSLIRRVTDTGANGAHVRLLMRSLLLGEDPFRPDRRFPKALQAVCPDIQEAFSRLLDPVATLESDSGDSRKILFALKDGLTVESVILPRDALCVSCQVGCAVGCLFCQTGKSGLARQLDALEIIAQVAYAVKQKPSTKRVVFMGMGEPSHNSKAVLAAIDFLADYGEFAHKDLVVSTVGDERLFEAMRTRRVKPALAISLHTTDDALRARLLPKAARIPVETLFARAREYAALTHYPVQFEWTMIKGVNDTDAEIERLALLMKDVFGMVNFIAYNKSPGSPFERPSRERMVEIVQRLRNEGLVATIRDSAAQGIEGGCGQLRARHLEDA